MESFLYCWTDIATNKLYIGKHKGTITDGYICSSKYMSEQYCLRPNDFTREILASGADTDMIALETAILLSVDAAKSSDFYNMHNNKGKIKGVSWHTDETKQKMSIAALKKYKNNPIFRQEASTRGSLRIGSLNTFYGKTHTIEARKAMGFTKKTLFAGSGNPKAKTVKYNGKIYLTMKEMSVAENISMHAIRCMIARKEVEIIA